MSNIDKQACQVGRYDLVSGYMQKWPDGEFVYHSDYLALLDELEAQKKRIAEQVEIIAKQEKWIKDVEATMITATDRAEAAEKRIAELEAPAPELKMAHLINKFYERYPLEEFKSDTERSAALGYFMAGAELQCFGEFINYAELMGDE